MTAGRIFLTLVAVLPVMQPVNFSYGEFVVPPADVLFLVVTSVLALKVLEASRPAWH